MLGIHHFPDHNLVCNRLTSQQNSMQSISIKTLKAASVLTEQHTSRLFGCEQDTPRCFGGNNKWPGSYGGNGTCTGSFGGNNTGLVILVGIAMPRQFWQEQQTSCYNHYVVLVGSVLLPYYGIFGNRMAGIYSQLALHCF